MYDNNETFKIHTYLVKVYQTLETGLDTLLGLVRPI